METFDEYLESKKIDSKAFNAGDNVRWEEFRLLFGQMHPKSLTAQKLFLINDIRRKYPLKVEEVKKEVKKVAARPVMKPKPQKTTSKDDKEPASASENKAKSVVKPKLKPKVAKPKVVIKPKIKPPKKD